MPLVEQPLITTADSRWQGSDAAAWASKNIYNAANDQRRHAYSHENRYIP